MGKEERRVMLQVYGPLGLNLKEVRKHNCTVVVVDSFYRSEKNIPYCAEASRQIRPGDMIERVDGISVINAGMEKVYSIIRDSIRDHKLGIWVRKFKHFSSDMAEAALRKPNRFNGASTYKNKPAPKLPPKLPGPKPSLRSRAPGAPAPAADRFTRKASPPPVPRRNSNPRITHNHQVNDELAKAKQEAEANKKAAEAAQAEIERLRAQLARASVQPSAPGPAVPARPRRRSSIQLAAQASAVRKSLERTREPPRRVSKPTATAHQASGTIIDKYRITDLPTIQQIMFAGSNKWNIVVLEPKGKPLGMEIVKVKTKNERGQSVKRIQIAGFYRDGDRVCVAEKSGQVEPDDEIKVINGVGISTHTQAISRLKHLCATGATIVLSLIRRKTPGPSQRANKRLSVGRPTY